MNQTNAEKKIRRIKRLLLLNGAIWVLFISLAFGSSMIFDLGKKCFGDFYKVEILPFQRAIEKMIGIGPASLALNKESGAISTGEESGNIPPLASLSETSTKENDLLPRIISDLKTGIFAPNKDSVRKTLPDAKDIVIIEADEESDDDVSLSEKEDSNVKIIEGPYDVVRAEEKDTGASSKMPTEAGAEKQPLQEGTIPASADLPDNSLITFPGSYGGTIGGHTSGPEPDVETVSVTPPEDLAVSSENGGCIELIWDSSNSRNAVSIRVYRKSSGEVEFKKIADVGIQEKSYKDTDISTGVLYCYKIKGVSSSGEESDYSNEAYGISGLSYNERVLVLANSSSAESVETAAYYQKARAIPTENILALPISDTDGLSASSYANEIKEPLKAYISNTCDKNGLPLKHKILIIAATYGTPYRCKNDDGSITSLDAEIEGLFGEYPEPNTSAILTTGCKGYIVSRIDGQSVEAAKGLIDKALYAEKYLDVTSGFAYFDKLGPNGETNSFIDSASNVTAYYGIQRKYSKGDLKDFKARDCMNAVIYYGWQNGYDDEVFRWKAGAVGCAVGDDKLLDLRAKDTWLSGAIADNITAAVGFVNKADEDVDPFTDFIGPFLRGHNFAEASSVVPWNSDIVRIGDPLYAITPFSSEHPSPKPPALKFNNIDAQLDIEKYAITFNWETNVPSFSYLEWGQNNIYELTTGSKYIVEDAEAADCITRWGIFQNIDKAASVKKVFDNGKKSNVIELTGTGSGLSQNIYEFPKTPVSDLGYKEDSIFSIAVKGDETLSTAEQDFEIVVKCQTTDTSIDYYIRYATDGLMNKIDAPNHIYHHLSPIVKDGQWHNILCNLDYDLNLTHSGIEALAVTEIYIYTTKGKLLVDDIGFLRQDDKVIAKEHSITVPISSMGLELYTPDAYVFNYIILAKDDAGKYLISDEQIFTIKSSSISGKVAIQEKADYSDTEVTFQFREPGGAVHLDGTISPLNDKDANKYGVQVQLASDGGYALFGILPGIYDITVKAPNSLMECKAGIRIEGDSDLKNIDFGPLLVGDVTGNNVIDLLDEEMWRDAWRDFVHGGIYDANTDLNGDGVINETDLAILLENKGKTGYGGELLLPPEISIESILVNGQPQTGDTIAVNENDAITILVKSEDKNPNDALTLAVEELGQLGPTANFTVSDSIHTAVTGTLAWTPTWLQGNDNGIGGTSEYNITFAAKDGTFTTSKNIIVSVNDIYNPMEITDFTSSTAVDEEENLEMQFYLHSYPGVNIRCELDESQLQEWQKAEIESAIFSKNQNQPQDYTFKFNWMPSVTAVATGGSIDYALDFVFYAEKEAEAGTVCIETVTKKLVITVRNKPVPPKIATGLSLVKQSAVSFLWPSYNDEAAEHILRYGKYVFTFPVYSWVGYQESGYEDDGPDFKMFDVSDPKNIIHVKDGFIPLAKEGYSYYYPHIYEAQLINGKIYLYREIEDSNPWDYFNFEELVVIDLSALEETGDITYKVSPLGNTSSYYSQTDVKFIDGAMFILDNYGDRLRIFDIRNLDDIKEVYSRNYQTGMHVKMEVFLKDGKAYTAFFYPDYIPGYDGTGTSGSYGMSVFDLTQIGNNEVVYDMFIGDNSSYPYFVRNSGSPQAPDWLPPEEYPGLSTWYYPTKPTFCDIDGDGDYDLFMGANRGASPSYSGRILFYKNSGSSTTPNLGTSPENYQYNGIDVGDGSAPTFCDIDGNGTYDLFIGVGKEPLWKVSTYYYKEDRVENKGSFYECKASYTTVEPGVGTNWTNYWTVTQRRGGTIYFYKNKGTQQSASWEAAVAKYNSIDVGGDSVPTFCDIDADGDYDLFVGATDGTIYFYENEGSRTSAVWAPVVKNYAGIDVGDYSAPNFCDIDADGDYDLFVGEKDGNINFYENKGTPQEANFELVTETYEDIDVGDYSAPVFCDIMKYPVKEKIFTTLDGVDITNTTKALIEDDLQGNGRYLYLLMNQPVGEGRLPRHGIEVFKLAKGQEEISSYKKVASYYVEDEPAQMDVAALTDMIIDGSIIYLSVKGNDTSTHGIMALNQNEILRGAESPRLWRCDDLRFKDDSRFSCDSVGEYKQVVYDKEGMLFFGVHSKTTEPMCNFIDAIKVGLIRDSYGSDVSSYFVRWNDTVRIETVVEDPDKMPSPLRVWIQNLPDFLTYDFDENSNILVITGTALCSEGIYEFTIHADDGESDTTQTVKVTVFYTAPIADFAESSNGGTAPLTVDFTDKSTGTIEEWLWDFGDGETSTEQNPTRTYNMPGIYTVTLTTTGPKGADVKTKSNCINVAYPPPVADVAATPTSGAAPLIVSFTDISTGSVTAYLWNFGDGAISQEKNPMHTYSTPGVYTVRLAVTGLGGNDAETKTDYITVVYPPPVADFIASPTTGDVPLAVSFTDTSIGSITSWSWNFGDGQTSTEENPSHIYNSVGTFNVKLTVTGPGGTDTKDMMNGISVVFGGKINKAYSDVELIPTNEPLVLHAELTANDFTSYGWLCDGYEFAGGVVSESEGETVTITDSLNMEEHASYFTPGTHEIELRASNDDLGITLYSEPFTITVLAVMDSSVIQAAIDGASPGETILIEPRLYVFTSNLRVTKNITIKASDANIDNTVFKLGNYGIFIKDPRFYSQSEYYSQLFKYLNDVTIEGITIRSHRGNEVPMEQNQTGYGEKYNGAIQNYSGKLTLRNCKVIDNEGIKVGAIYSCWNSKLYLENTLIAKNKNLPATSVSPYGGRYGSNVYCGTIYLSGSSKFYSTNSTIADNINGSQPFTQTGYSITVKYGAVYRDYQNYLTMTNSIMWGNGINGQDFSHRDNRQRNVIITYCDLQSPGIYMDSSVTNIYENVIHENPEFVDEVNYDYNINDTSPCRGTGENGSDIGAEFE